MYYIHIAGTNAKGSTAQYLFEILSQNYKCGLFTSPHLFSPLERFLTSERTITQEEYDKYMTMQKGEESEHLFRLWTRVALQWFHDMNVEFAILETGLGGLHDSTNLVKTQMQIITPISYDHMDILGNTLEEIASEKAGIIKENSIVLSHPQQPEALRIIRDTCKHFHTEFHLLNESDITNRSNQPSGQTFDFSYQNVTYQNLFISALSPHQVQNACVCIMAAQALGICQKDIYSGLKKTSLQARAQIKGNLIIDGAHNIAALQELQSTMKTYFPGKKAVVLLSLMRDKEIERITQMVQAFASHIVTTCADANRGMDADKLASYFPCAQSFKDPTQAFHYAKQLAEDQDAILVVCGSFYLASKVLALLNQKNQAQ